LTGVSCFMLKGLFFGANFSIKGLVVWGYGVALLLAGSWLYPITEPSPPRPMAGFAPHAPGVGSRDPITSARLDPFREWVRRNFPLVAFLGSYAFFTVLANVVYPFADWGGSSMLGFRLSQFPLAYTPGYWMLLFMPFVLAPLVAFATRRIFH